MLELNHLQHILLDTIRRLQPCQMSEVLAETEISRLLESEISLADLRQALSTLAHSRYVRDLPPHASPLWRITPAGAHILSAVRAAPRGCPPHSSPEQPA